MSTIGWIDPDALWTTSHVRSSKCVPFIYNGTMHYGSADKTHTAMMRLNTVNADVCRQALVDIQSTALLGRASWHQIDKTLSSSGDHLVRIVSFWNKEKRIYDQLLHGCLEQLLKDNVIDNTCLVSTPLINTVPLSQVFKQQPKTLSHAEQMQIDAKNQQHLNAGTMKADREKKELRGDAIKVNPDPFAKYMVPAESIFDRKLAAILESLCIL